MESISKTLARSREISDALATHEIVCQKLLIPCKDGRILIYVSTGYVFGNADAEIEAFENGTLFNFVLSADVSRLELRRGKTRDDVTLDASEVTSSIIKYIR